MKKSIAVLVAVLLLVFVFACCGTDTKQPDAQNGNENSMDLSETENEDEGLDASEESEKMQTPSGLEDVNVCYEYMTLEEITETGYYPCWMQPYSVIIYDENGIPTIVEGGELTPEDVEGRDDIASVGFLQMENDMKINPDTKAEYDLYGFIQNIYYKWPGEDDYRLAPPGH